MNLDISDNVREKLNARDIIVDEVLECFLNREMAFRKDKRPEHLTEPTTRYFLAETDQGRWLKIAFVPHREKYWSLKTAYDCDDE